MTQDISQLETEYNESREGQTRFNLIWIEARNRDTDALEAIGFWDGPYDTNFAVDGETRLYLGAGAALAIDDIPGGVGMDIRYITAKLATVPEVIQAILEYDPRLAPVEVHTVPLDLQTGNPAANPRRVFKGRMMEAPIEEDAEGGSLSIVARLASAARALTLKQPLYRSDTEMRRRASDDKFREYVAEAPLKQVPWGEEKVKE